MTPLVGDPSNLHIWSFSIATVTIYYKFSGLKHYSFIISQL